MFFAEPWQNSKAQCSKKTNGSATVATQPEAQRMREQYGTDITLCPKCKQGKMVLIAVVYPAIFKAIPAKELTVNKQIGLHNKASP